MWSFKIQMYKTLKEIISDIITNDLKFEEEDFMYLDNDEVSLILNNEVVYREDPSALLRQCLSLLGIRWRNV